MNNQDKIISIVVTYNADNWLTKCFNSLIDCEIENHIIYAIDNGSSDNTVLNIKRKFPQINLIETGENLGFGKANNIGLKLALETNANYVFLLNQDAWIKRDTIKRLIYISKNHPYYGIVSPIHLNNENKLDNNFASYCIKDINSSFLLNSFKNTTHSEIYPCKFVNAAAWLLPIETIKTNGGFMPIFPHYGEDANYCERVINSGLKIGFTPGETIIHDRNNSIRKLTLKQEFNKVYVYLLIIFASQQSTSLKYSIVRCLKLIDANLRHPKRLILIPFALIKIIRNSYKIIKQRNLSLKSHHNFVE